MGCGNSTDPKQDPPSSDAPQAADAAAAEAAPDDNTAAPGAADTTSVEPFSPAAAGSPAAAAGSSSAAAGSGASEQAGPGAPPAAASPDSSILTIKVRNMIGEVNFFDVKANDTLLFLKQAIEKKMKTKVQKQRLTLAGHEIDKEDDTLICYCGLSHNSELMVVGNKSLKTKPAEKDEPGISATELAAAISRSRAPSPGGAQ